LSTLIRTESRNSQRHRDAKPAPATVEWWNATKPLRLPCAASVSTRIRSAHVLAALRQPLRRRTSLRRFVQVSLGFRFCVTVSAPASFSSLARRRCLRRDRIIQAAPYVAQYPQTRKRRLSTRNLRSPRRLTQNHAIHSGAHLRRDRKCGTTLRRRRTRAQTRRSRTSCPVRLRSARESDLRASSLPFSSHYGVELRSGASFNVSSGLHRPKRDLRTASFSQLARQRCR
jgi:hypothetical protein